ncbi:AraC family transcriptional regulator [Clostridium thermosuccinogenes]|mgnify:FL=1|jgi:AraC-like DNA-binding protein|uniref:AraC family transcriptional regulator n=1 Tax=Clostridium thermosuccinogenes TaxID=84032 RepID=A0A2K2F8A6_9CLOT|nr:AraC family transcriptional regulator [Pseudoclostridium thermosuccinogenes]AUS96822.1 AraC family transcriptional regulator [Pseudoclostridium thermosuccinogenes]PNT95010.1 AraC family transcriptional regulator [Pseudoclostridium thermosuccinogenes]PNT95693.1 AraC family transcriptional regulator [Pseudoclostridium thermosuccinogenes]
MIDFIPVKKLDHKDLYVYQCGSQFCEPGHSYGPAVRDHYLIHYIHSGKGIFQVDDKTYHLKKGNGFLICPDIITYYEADLQDPWHYSWIGFHGLEAERYLKLSNLSMDNPIFMYDKDDSVDSIFKQMHSTINQEKCREIKLLGLLWLFLSHLVEISPLDYPENEYEDRQKIYVRKAIEFIESNYSHHINISAMSRYIGLDRSYLNSVFKMQTKKTLKQYLIEFRIKKACELMYNDTLSIGDISRSVGYEDPLLFSKIFKKIKGQSPREYRKSLAE